MSSRLIVDIAGEVTSDVTKVENQDNSHSMKFIVRTESSDGTNSVFQDFKVTAFGDTACDRLEGVLRQGSFFYGTGEMLAIPFVNPDKNQKDKQGRPALMSYKHLKVLMGDCFGFVNDGNMDQLTCTPSGRAIAHVAGVVARAPDFSYTTKGTEVLKFSIATDFWTTGKTTTQWVQVTLWGKEAEAKARIIGKDTFLTVSGEVSVNVYYDRQNNISHSIQIKPFLGGLSLIKNFGAKYVNEALERDLSSASDTYMQPTDADPF